MGRADHWVGHTNNVICDRCGFKFKAGELRRTWDGLWVCREDWEPRHPQDYVKGVRDIQKPVLSRPEAPDIFTASAVALTMWGDGK
jgi:hypothetical protein